MTAPASRITHVLLVGAFLLLAFAPSVLAHHVVDTPPVTAGDDKQIVKDAQDEAQRFRDEGEAYVDALVRNFRECMLEENPDCGVWPLLP